MGALKYLTLSGFLLLTGCQFGYIASSAYHQAKILYDRTPLEQALQDPLLTAEEREKILLAKEALQFAETEFKLHGNGNYTSFVKLNRPYVSWAVSAAHSWELKHHQFQYPIVGKMPYKGFFSEDDAQQEAKKLEKQNLDVYVRGITAYSTLGWFRDPILSSMLAYKKHDLVNTIIHETVHTTLYIKNSADFNERLAVFIGNLGTELFFKNKEGVDSPTLKIIQDENNADKIFSAFITQELSDLENWYKLLPEQQRTPEIKEQRLSKIQENFRSEIQPKLPAGSYKTFASRKLNNAYLMVFKTYMQDLSDFERLYNLCNYDFKVFFDAIKTLEKHPKPEVGLKELIAQFKKDSEQTAPFHLTN
ncbi:MAG: aminopeptidase [Bdellovibrionia bacterium]